MEKRNDNFMNDNDFYEAQDFINELKIMVRDEKIIDTKIIDTNSEFLTEIIENYKSIILTR